GTLHFAATARRSIGSLLWVGTWVSFACVPAGSELVDAVKRGDASATRSLLDRGQSIEGRDREGNTPLMLAALHGDAALVELLLARHADARAKNRERATALHWSIDDDAKIEALLAAGADPNAEADSGFTPLMLAASRDANAASVKVLLDHGADVKQG